MAGTVATWHIIGEYQTVLFYPHSVAYLNGTLLVMADGTNSPGGAYMAATVAFRSAESTLETHFGLHESEQVAAGTKHIVGALGHTQLASRTVSFHIF